MFNYLRAFNKNYYECDVSFYCVEVISSYIDFFVLVVSKKG